MKLFISIIVAVLMFSILLIPSDDAPTKVYFEYILWSCGALFIVNRIFKYYHEDEE
jgi:hypothetical protein